MTSKKTVLALVAMLVGMWIWWLLDSSLPVGPIDVIFRCAYTVTMLALITTHLLLQRHRRARLMALGDGLHYFNRNGEPIDLMTWAFLIDDPMYKIVARTTIVSAANPSVAYDVSTVWLGIDHNFGHDPILIFETMIFDAGDAKDCNRYSTVADAIAGHADMVTVVASTMDDPVIMDANETERRPNG